MKCGRKCLVMLAVTALLVMAGLLVVAKPVWVNQQFKLFVYKVKNRLTPHKTVAELRSELFAVQPGTLVVGTGKSEIVEFVDYNCHGCNRQYRVLDGLHKEGLQYRLIVRHNPIKGKKSEQAALAVIAAGKQGKADRLHAALMAREDALAGDGIEAVAAGVGIDTGRLAADMKADEVVARLDADRDLAWKLRILGVPIFVTASEIHKGVLSREQLLDLLDKDGDFALRPR